MCRGVGEAGDGKSTWNHEANKEEEKWYTMETGGECKGSVSGIQNRAVLACSGEKTANPASKHSPQMTEEKSLPQQ